MKHLLLLLLCTSWVWAEGWLTSWDQAVTASKKSGKPILMEFTGSDWCPYCTKFQKEVLSTSQFQEWAARNVVLLELDFPRSSPQSEALKKQNAGLKEKYHQEIYPTVVVVDATGKEIGRTNRGKDGPAAYIETLEKLIKK